MFDTQRRQRTKAAVDELCATATDSTRLFREVSELLHPVLPYEVAAWLTTDPDTSQFSSAVIEEFDAKVCQPWFDNELGGSDANYFPELALGAGTAVLSRSVNPAASQRWRDIMRPIGLDAELRSTFTDAQGCWGVVELHRASGEPDFTSEDAAMVRLVSRSLATGLRRIELEQAARASTGPDGPGLWFVTDDGLVTGATDVGQEWLNLLEPSHGALTRAALHTLTAQLHTGVARHRHVRTRTVDGRLVSLHASPLVDGAGLAVIIEPSRESDISAVLTLAYGLSPREREVVTALSRGCTTEQIAAELVISPHTVRDHVKAALAKVGVSSRSELVGVLFASHYAHQVFGSPH